MQIHSVAGALVVTTIVSGLLFGFLEVGYRLGRHVQRHTKTLEGTSVVEGAVLGLLSLMLTFSLAQSKEGFSTRKKLFVDTVNAVTTAYDRIALMPDPERRGSVRHLMAEYVVQLGAASQENEDRKQRENPHRKKAVSLQHAIWEQSVAGCAQDDSCKQVYLPSVNELSQVAFEHLALTQSHKPWALLGFLVVLACCGAVLGGFALVVYGTRQWTLWSLYVFSIAVSLYMIIDVEFPTHWGFVRIQAGTVGLEEILVRFAQ